MGPNKMDIVATTVAVVLTGCFETALAQAITWPTITCLAEFAYTGDITVSPPFATASGGQGKLKLTSDPPDRINSPALNFNLPNPQVLDMGTFYVVDEAGRDGECTATVTVVDRPEIDCVDDAEDTAPAGSKKELSLKAPLATASKGAGTLKITPPAVNDDVSFYLVVPWSRQATFTVTDFLGTTASCTVSLRVTAEDCDPEDDICGDPHMRGLRGQKIDWSGVDGGWYSLVKDTDADLNVNVRLTAPLPEEFPDRQLITGISVLCEGHSVIIEVKNPYETATDGCPDDISPCLANGGLRVVVDDEEVNGLLTSSRNEYVTDGIAVSASNLPVECRQFGGDKIWARMYDEMLHGQRQLASEESFEDWILRSERMAAPDWCAQFIGQNDIARVQSTHSVFKVVTTAVTVRLNAGVNYQGDGDVNGDGRVLPDLEFWQMDMGLHGLSLESESLSGLLGETARPVLDKDGREVMQGLDAFRGTVADYRVSGPLGADFTLLHKQDLY